MPSNKLEGRSKKCKSKTETNKYMFINLSNVLRFDKSIFDKSILNL